MRTILQDLRYGARVLGKSPGFTAMTVITLALGIGANSAIFSVINGVLLTPLPYKDPSRLVRIFEEFPEYHNFPVSPADFLDYRARNQVFDGMAIYVESDLQLAENGRAEKLSGMRVSSGLFHLLGRQPILGRDFGPEDELAGSEHRAVISHNLWQNRFASDPAVIGKSVTLDGNPFTIIGVLPSGFASVGGSAYHSPPHGAAVDVYWPFPLDARKKQRGSHYLNAIARLKPGVTLEKANAQMAVLAAELQKLYPDSNTNSNISVHLLRDEIIGGTGKLLLVLLGAVGFVLLIACINVANLLLSNASGRSREIAVRSALGARRARLVRQMLTESLLIAFAGGGTGFVLGIFGVRLFAAVSPEKLPRAQMIHVDFRMLGFTLAVAALTGVIFGIVPSIQATRGNLNEFLKEGGRGSTGAKHRRIGSALVIAEISLATLLLVGAVLLMRSLLYLENVDPGFSPDHVLTFSLSLPYKLYPEKKIGPFYQQLLAEIRNLPGVTYAGATSDLPWTGYDENTSFDIEGRPSPPDNGPHARYHFITPDYFKAIGVPLVEGRLLQQSDSADSLPVILINMSMARAYWPSGESPLGKRLDLWGKKRTIVGIVGDVKDTPQAAQAEPAFYFPLSQVEQSDMLIAVKSANDPAALAGPVREAVHRLDGSLAVSDVKPLTEIASDSVSTPRFTFLLVGFFAVTALLLAGIGIYGVMSNSVNQRTHEIGVRIALGARRGNVLRLVLTDGMTLVVIGTAVGFAGSLTVSRVLASLLYGVSTLDKLTFAVAPVVSISAAFLACYLPARRATGADPMAALRQG